MRRQRGLRAHLAALALQAFQQRGFLAADIGAGADALLDVEGSAPSTMADQPRARDGQRASKVAMACGYSERV